MAIKKKNNSRKALAVALGIMGIAGLSLASASQLNINPAQELQVGSGTFANCQGTTAIVVDYTYETPATVTSKVTGIVFSSIEAACKGKSLTFSLAHTGADSPLAPATAHSLVSADVGTTGSYTYTLTSSQNVPLSYDLGAINIVIK